MAVATKDIEVETNTFKVAETPASPDYHLKVVTVGPQATLNGRVVTSDMFDMEIKQWLDGGWRIFSIDYIGPEREAGGQGPITGHTFAYHFVK